MASLRAGSLYFGIASPSFHGLSPLGGGLSPLGGGLSPLGGGLSPHGGGLSRERGGLSLQGKSRSQSSEKLLNSSGGFVLVRCLKGTEL